MRNNLLFTAMSLIFIILCVIFVFFTKDNEEKYIRLIETETAVSFAFSEDSAETEETKQTQITEKTISAEESNDDTKININTADLNELMTLTGIGEVIGQRIIDYRNENGLFYNIEELMDVSGIGEKSFEKIKDKITV